MRADLGQYRVHGQIAELLPAADVAVQCASHHAEASGEGAHAERGRAIGCEDRQSLGDSAFRAGKAKMAVNGTVIKNGA